MAGECRLPGLNLDQHDSVLLYAFVHAVGGVVGFALPCMCLSYRMVAQPSTLPVVIIMLQ